MNEEKEAQAGITSKEDFKAFTTAVPDQTFRQVMTLQPGEFITVRLARLFIVNAHTSNELLAYDQLGESIAALETLGRPYDPSAVFVLQTGSGSALAVEGDVIGVTVQGKLVHLRRDLLPPAVEAHVLSADPQARGPIVVPEGLEVRVLPQRLSSFAVPNYDFDQDAHDPQGNITSRSASESEEGPQDGGDTQGDTGSADDLLQNAVDDLTSLSKVPSDTPAKKDPFEAFETWQLERELMTRRGLPEGNPYTLHYLYPMLAQHVGQPEPEGLDRVAFDRLLSSESVLIAAPRTAAQEEFLKAFLSMMIRVPAGLSIGDLWTTFAKEAMQGAIKHAATSECNCDADCDGCGAEELYPSPDQAEPRTLALEHFTIRRDRSGRPYEVEVNGPAGTYLTNVLGASTHTTRYGEQVVALAFSAKVVTQQTARRVQHPTYPYFGDAEDDSEGDGMKGAVVGYGCGTQPDPDASITIRLDHL